MLTLFKSSKKAESKKEAIYSSSLQTLRYWASEDSQRNLTCESKDHAIAILQSSGVKQTLRLSNQKKVKALMSPEKLNEFFKDELDQVTAKDSSFESKVSGLFTAEVMEELQSSKSVTEPLKGKTCLVAGELPEWAKQFNATRMVFYLGGRSVSKMSPKVDIAFYDPMKVSPSYIDKLKKKHPNLDFRFYDDLVDTFVISTVRKRIQGRRIVMIGKPPKGWSTIRFESELMPMGAKDVTAKFFKDTKLALVNPNIVNTGKAKLLEKNKIYHVPYTLAIAAINGKIDEATFEKDLKLQNVASKMTVSQGRLAFRQVASDFISHLTISED